MIFSIFFILRNNLLDLIIFLIGKKGKKFKQGNKEKGMVIARRVKKQSNHIRYNMQTSPRQDQSLGSSRLYIAVVSDASTSALMMRALNLISRKSGGGQFDDAHTGERILGRVQGSNYFFEYRAYDVFFNSSIVDSALGEVGVPCIKDERIFERTNRYQGNQFRNEPTKSHVKGPTDFVRKYYEG